MSLVVLTILLILLTLVALATEVIAMLRLRRREQLDGPLARWQHVGTWIITLSCAAAFVVRWVWVTQRWVPVSAHLDGLLLIITLLGITLLFIQARPKLHGLTAFAMPVILLALLWAICAANWTYQPFDIATDDLWLVLHLVCIYIGTVCAFVAAIAGGMYLFVQRRLRHKTVTPQAGRLASLETLETLIIRTATLGFALLSLGLISGLVIISARTTLLGEQWYWSPKVLLGATAWAVFAVVMNVRYATAFRGARAAYLSIAGLVLLLATYGAVTMLLDHDQVSTDDVSPPAVSAPSTMKEAP